MIHKLNGPSIQIRYSTDYSSRLIYAHFYAVVERVQLAVGIGAAISN